MLKIEADGIQGMAAGDRVEVFLENDYAVPGSISTGSVSFIIGSGATPNNANAAYGSTISAASVSVDDGGDIPGTDTDGDAHSIVAEIPDFDPRDDNRYFPNASPVVSDTLTLVIETSAGIKNPSEQGNHSIGYSVLTGVEIADGTAERRLPDLETKAKISLDSDDGGRGKEVIITGSGFNDGTIAEAYVLVETGAAPGCQTIIDDGTSLGTADVGSDDKFSIAFNVHQDDFDPGNINYICASDSEAPKNRLASAVKPFDLTPSVTFEPTAVNSGDEVTVKPRDFGGDITSINLGGEVVLDSDDWTEDGSDLLFAMPGGLSGTVNVSVTDGTDTKRVDIVVTPSGLELSKSAVAPNETIIISGTGFSENATIVVGDIKIDGKALDVDSAGTELVNGVLVVRTTSSGGFTATASVWHVSVCNPPNSDLDCSSNPVLSDGDYTVKATDSRGYEGKTTITILEPTLSVNPAVASARGYITISGANWPVSTSSDDNDVTITVDGRERSASVDSTGRFNYSYQLSGSIDIGTSHTITVSYDGGNGGNIKEEIDFDVPESNVVLSPGAAAPGETISLEITGMPIYTLVDHVKIDSADRLDVSYNTDAEGNVTVTGILVPFLDPGFYPVEVKVGDETSVVQLEILAEATVAGTAQSVSDALSEISGSLVRVFHFNNTSKVWTFYDPRPEFEGLNTLSELADGQPLLDTGIGRAGERGTQRTDP